MLENVTLAQDTIAIKGNAFTGCTNLKYIIIPETVTSIDDYAFNSCLNLDIFCEIATSYTGWKTFWSNGTHHVYMKDTWHYENGIPKANT